MSKRLLNRQGTMTIELSIIFPIFCMIAMTFVFFMHGIVLEIGMGVAAREGGREYALNHRPERAVEKTQFVLDEFMIDKTTIHIHNRNGAMGIVVDRPYGIYIPFIGEKKYDLRRMMLFHPETVEE